MIDFASGIISGVLVYIYIPKAFTLLVTKVKAVITNIKS